MSDERKTNETSFGCVVCDADPTHLREQEPALFCTTHKPDGAAELCEGCRPRATDRNHPPGMIFVGWGHGWQPCKRCGGSGLERDRHCDDRYCELGYGHKGVHKMGLYVRMR